MRWALNEYWLGKSVADIAQEAKGATPSIDEQRTEELIAMEKNRFIEVCFESVL